MEHSEGTEGYYVFSFRCEESDYPFGVRRREGVTLRSGE